MTRKSNHTEREVFIEVKRRTRLQHVEHDKLAPVNRHMRRRLKALGRER